MKITIKEAKPLDKWSNRDFLIYYSILQQENNGFGLSIPPEAWGAYLSKIKGFRIKNNVSNEEYKDFIDDVFNLLYKQGFAPSFGTITSDKVFSIIHKKKTCTISNDQFEKLKESLYQDNTLFKNLIEAARKYV